MTYKHETMAPTKQYRFSLTVTKPEDMKVIKEFKEICKREKKRFTSVTVGLLREYIDDYKATR